MIDFLQVLKNPDNGFLRLALGVGTLASFSFGIIGTYVTTRRISYLSGAIAHCVFGGIGAALFLKHRMGLTGLDPMAGAFAAAIIAAVIMGWVSLYAKEREDTVIGALWAVGMAAGLIFIDLTPGYFDIMSYLFGDILLISMQDLWLVIALDVVVGLITVFFYNTILAVSFDDEFALLRGINVKGFYILLLCLTAVTVVLLVRVVGIVMVIALLTLPAATAGQFTRRFWQTMVLATVFCIAFMWTGIGVSFVLKLSSGPTIIIIAGISYLAVLGGKRIFSKG
ncbi:MAG: metal ABC transporter permease [Deltaproteobacteria bacterium]